MDLSQFPMGFFLITVDNIAAIVSSHPLLVIISLILYMRYFFYFIEEVGCQCIPRYCYWRKMPHDSVGYEREHLNWKSSEREVLLVLTTISNAILCKMKVIIYIVGRHFIPSFYLYKENYIYYFFKIYL